MNHKTSQPTATASATAVDTAAILAPLPDLLTVPEVGQVLRISRQSAYEVIASGLIPSVRIGRTIRVLKTDLAAFLRGDRPAA